MDILSSELNELDQFDMSEYEFEDFTEDDIDIQEDNWEDQEEIKVEAKTKYGEKYQLGNHILMCGDSTKGEDVESLMGGGDSRPGRNGPTIQREHFKQRRNDDRKRQHGHDTILQVFIVGFQQHGRVLKRRRGILHLVRKPRTHQL